MYTKEEEKDIKREFWEEFRRYCKQNKIRRRWLLNHISVSSSQLKFDANREKAVVGIQVDHKKISKKHLIFSYWEAYKVIIEDSMGESLIWDKEYLSNDNRFVSFAYFKLDGVNFLNKNDWEKIFKFFAEKMIKIEDMYYEVGDSIVESIKNKS
ncbi:DUF4268 domain-containing protein [Marinilabiliaceae bacterium JC040]|nr:DUF4268 domain-containing protein [Marinilabiliaceae bacterium JC040]